MSAALPARVRDRVALAADAGTGVEVLTLLAADRSPAVRRAVAGRAVPELLALLAADRDLRTREAVVTNPVCPAAVLTRMVADPHWSVRGEVPEHPNLDAEAAEAVLASPHVTLRTLLAGRKGIDAAIERRLAADPAAVVRGSVARFTSVPDVLAVLVEDPETMVRASAADNPRLTTGQRSRLVRDRRSEVRVAVVNSGGRFTDEESLLLARDRSVEVRWWLATSSTVPGHILRILLSDADEGVVCQAQAAMRRSHGRNGRKSPTDLAQQP
ncbi:hypothetical protein [Nonomuraea longicatena]